MPIADLTTLQARFRELHCTQVFGKELSENDNSKQQIYLGKSFTALNILPYGQVTAVAGLKRPNFKATVHLRWIDEARDAVAPGARLILYPDYPEVRLSGFLRGCAPAPSAALQPIPRAKRRFNNGPDGRVLFLGITPERVICAYLAEANSAISREFIRRAPTLPELGVFRELTRDAGNGARDQLIARLSRIHTGGWHPSCRMHADGVIRPYAARNGGGYTLEALCGVLPNARAEPDLLGWELKGYSADRITLMTPEPDVGFYAAQGLMAFVRRYGRLRGDDSMYFTGSHKFGEPCASTGLTLRLRGYEAATDQITDVAGGIELINERGELAAGWSFGRLIEHWGRKHALAAYVRFASRLLPALEYHYRSPALFGEGTEFVRLLAALAARRVIFDPGSKIEALSTRPRVKARSQFRIQVRDLAQLYGAFNEVDLRGAP